MQALVLGLVTEHRRFTDAAGVAQVRTVVAVGRDAIELPGAFHKRGTSVIVAGDLRFFPPSERGPGRWAVVGDSEVLRCGEDDDLQTLLSVVRVNVGGEEAANK